MTLSDRHQNRIAKNPRHSIHNKQQERKGNKKERNPLESKDTVSGSKHATIRRRVTKKTWLAGLAGPGLAPYLPVILLALREAQAV